MTDKSRKIISILIVVIVLLLIILAYALIIRPKISGFVFNKQIEGYQIAYSEILRVVSQCQTIPLNNSGTTITLVALECLQGNPGQNETAG